MTGSRSARDILSRPAEVISPPRTDWGGRLLVIVVGIDHYEDPTVPDLTCAVNDAESIADAICHTQPIESLELRLLADPARDAKTGQPLREEILAAARAVAASATALDTVLIYYAGHGGILHRQPCLFPADVRLDEERGHVKLLNTISVKELQHVFDSCLCRRRVMFLDCCQNSFSPAAATGTWFVPEPNAVNRALPWRTGMPLSTDLVDALEQSAQGWSLLIACGSNEVSLEDPEWGAHGIFSHFLATGLRGAADLDGDGIVSLPELVQYLAARIPKQAEAVIEDLRQRGGMPQTQQSRQNPTMVWSGPIAFPLTRCVDERRVPRPAGVLRLWLSLLAQRLPYTLAVEGMARYGTALLYGLAMALTVWLFTFRVRHESSTAIVVTVGVASGLLWLANFALAGAANELRWHCGGYVSAILNVAWHVAVFLFLLGLPVRAEPALVLQLAVGLLIVLVIMLVFGHNALHCIISLADLIKRDLRVAGRRAFVQLDRQWMHADIDNMIAMVSAHPKLYQSVGLVVVILAVGHAAYALVTLSHAEGVSLQVARDFTLLVLVQWQVQWFSASFRILRGILLPER